METYLPTESDKHFLMEMRKMIHDAHPGLPLEIAPGMRDKKKPKKNKKKPKKSKKKPKKKKSKSKSPTKKQLMSQMYKKALAREGPDKLPLMRDRKYRDDYIKKIKTIPLDILREMKIPIQVLNYVPHVPRQSLGYSAADLGQTLVRTRAFNPKKTIYDIPNL